MSLHPSLRGRPAGLLAATALTVLLTALLAPFREEVGLLNQGLIFLLLTLLVSAIWGREVGLYTAVLTNLSLNFFFIRPHYTFTVQDPKNIVALVIFLIVSVVGSSLLSAAARPPNRRAVSKPRPRSCCGSAAR